MRKWVAVVLTVLMVIMLAACGGNGQSQSSGNSGSGGNSGSSESSGSSGSSEKPIELTYAFFAPATTFPAVQMEKWKTELEKRTNGKVVVNLFPGGTLLAANNMFDGVANGVADIGLTATSYEPGRFPLYMLSDMPFGYPSAEVASKVVFDLIQQYPADALKDYKVITAFATEPSYIQSKKSGGSTDDLKGQRLRIAGGNTSIVEVLGATPVGMSQAEALEALQTGVIEGYVSSREVLKDMKYAEIVKYVTDYPLQITTFVAVMNKSKWDSLPADVQKVIDELAPEMAAFAGSYLDGIVNESMKWSEDNHQVQTVSLSPEEKAKWDKYYEELRQKVIDDLKSKGLPADEYAQKVLELIDKHSK